MMRVMMVWGVRMETGVIERLFLVSGRVRVLPFDSLEALCAAVVGKARVTVVIEFLGRGLVLLLNL